MLMISDLFSAQSGEEWFLQDIEPNFTLAYHYFWISGATIDPRGLVASNVGTLW